MSNLRQAAQQALEALEVKQHILRQAVRLICEMSKQPLPQGIDDDSDAITALRAALAEPQTTHWEGCEAVHPECKTEQEPVGHADLGINNIYIFSALEPRVIPVGRTPLYTAPTARTLLTDYINAANINGADSPHMVVEKLQSAIERAHGIGGEA